MADGNMGKQNKASLNLLDGLQFGWGLRLPMILQTGATECGLACLAMIGCYHGHDIDLPSLRRRFNTSLKGASLTRLMSIAGDLGFSSRPLRLEIEQLGRLKVPCILHWNLNHFVVLKRVTARHAFIHDPARGVIRVNLKEVSKRFTGIALELLPTRDFKPVKDRESVSLRALAGTVRGVIPAMVQILILAVVLEVFSLVGPLYMQWILDHALVSADHDLLTLLGLAFLAVAIFRALITAARSWIVTWLSAVIDVQWVNNLFSHMLNLPLKWFETRHVGDVVSRFSSVQAIQRTLTTKAIGTVLDGMMSIITLTVLYFYSVSLACLVVVAFILYGVLRWAFYRPQYRANEEHIVYAARQQSELLESIRGVLPIKLGGKQTERCARYANATVEAVNRHISMQKLDISFSAFNQLIFGVGRVALIWIAATMVLNGAFTAGMLIAFAAYADQFHTRAANLIDKAVEFRMLKLHACRLADIALTEPEQTGQEFYKGTITDFSIEVQDVSYRYAEDEPWIIKDCSFRIEHGESVAITGPSGCGKTTLAKLLLGLLRPDRGKVLFGGVDIRRLGKEDFRNLVSAVMQDDQLFAGSVAENISFFDGSVGFDKIEDAAHTASVHEEIIGMPMGYQTMVGDMGSSLSGGQKQRIILARALCRDPKALVLDEATSALDAHREQQVSAAIEGLNLTRIIIAHRQETLASADRVLHMRFGSGMQEALPSE